MRIRSRPPSPARSRTGPRRRCSGRPHGEVSDLYAEGFNPVPGRHDFAVGRRPGALPLSDGTGIRGAARHLRSGYPARAGARRSRRPPDPAVPALVGRHAGDPERLVRSRSRLRLRLCGRPPVRHRIVQGAARVVLGDDRRHAGAFLRRRRLRADRRRPLSRSSDCCCNTWASRSRLPSSRMRRRG